MTVPQMRTEPMIDRWMPVFPDELWYMILGYLTPREMGRTMYRVSRGATAMVDRWVRERHFLCTGEKGGGRLLYQYPVAWGDHIPRTTDPYFPCVAQTDEKVFLLRPPGSPVDSKGYLDIPMSMRMTYRFVFWEGYEMSGMSMLDRLRLSYYNFCLPACRENDPFGASIRSTSVPKHQWVYRDRVRPYLYFETTLVGDVYDYDDASVCIGFSTTRDHAYTPPFVYWDSEDGAIYCENDPIWTFSPRFYPEETVGIGYIPASHEVFITRNGSMIVQFGAPWSPTLPRLFPIITTNASYTILFNPGVAPFLFTEN